MFKIDQICLNLIRIDQNCSNLIKLNQFGSNLIKLDQIGFLLSCKINILLIFFFERIKVLKGLARLWWLKAFRLVKNIFSDIQMNFENQNWLRNSDFGIFDSLLLLYELLSDFVSLHWKLENPYYHDIQYDPILIHREMIFVLKTCNLQ